MEHIFGNWYVNIKKMENGQWWLDACYQRDAPERLDDVAPDWGFSSDWHDSIQDAAVLVVNRVWTGIDSGCGGLDRAVELASALIALGIISPNTLINEWAAIIDGVWYFGHASELHPETDNGVQRWNKYIGSHTKPETLNFSKKGLKLAKAITTSAVQDQIAFNESYDAWEASWIDGPQYL